MEPRDSPTPEPLIGERGGRLAAVRVVVVAIAVITLALIKPWEVGQAPAVPSREPAASPSGAAPDAPASGPTNDDRLAAVCLRPLGWRIVATEVWRDRTVRAWKAIEAVEATGPEDPAIALALVAGEAVPALGWCSPVGADRPPPDARPTLYRLGSRGVREIAIRRLAPPDATSGGGLWLPPGEGVPSWAEPDTWPPGRYVIRISTPDGSWERWLGAEVVATPREQSTPSP